MATPRKNNSRRQLFRLAAPNATSVLLAGDFTDWQQHPKLMEKDKSGIWRTSVELAPGKHTYRFLVDGEWRNDPECVVRAPNPFGGENMVREAV